MDKFALFVYNHWILWLAFVMLFLAALVNELQLRKKKSWALSAPEVVDFMNHENALIFDLRDLSAFKKEHIINSQHINAIEFKKTDLEQYRQKKLIFVCGKGTQSAVLANELYALGFAANYLDGGLDNWKAAGLPLVNK